jgi:hypothetical protein
MIDMKRFVNVKDAPKPAAILTLPIDPLLKDLIWKKAYSAGMAMNEWVSKVLADHLDRPDLARIPRKPYGRPPIERNGTHARAGRKMAGAGK